MDIDEMNEETKQYCNICGIQKNLQQCKECYNYICYQPSCLNPICLSIDNWTCCLHCYQERMMNELENHIDESYINQCIYCGNINYNEDKCNCYLYKLDDDIDNDMTYPIDINLMNSSFYEDQLIDSLTNIHLSSNN